MAVVREDLIINSIIGEGTKFRGDFELNGLLRIDGVFEGTIESQGKVLVGRNGTAVSNKIEGKTIIIGGKVTGNITASESITILATGSVEGDIATPRLVAEEGVMINGKIKITPSQTKLKPIPEEIAIQQARVAIDGAGDTVASANDNSGENTEEQ